MKRRLNRANMRITTGDDSNIVTKTYPFSRKIIGAKLHAIVWRACVMIDDKNVHSDAGDRWPQLKNNQLKERERDESTANY